MTAATVTPARASGAAIGGASANGGEPLLQPNWRRNGHQTPNIRTNLVVSS